MPLGTPPIVVADNDRQLDTFANRRFDLGQVIPEGAVTDQRNDAPLRLRDRSAERQRKASADRTEPAVPYDLIRDSRERKPHPLAELAAVEDDKVFGSERLAQNRSDVERVKRAAGRRSIIRCAILDRMRASFLGKSGDDRVKRKRRLDTNVNVRLAIVLRIAFSIDERDTSV